jgi:hypothetical protein
LDVFPTTRREIIHGGILAAVGLAGCVTSRTGRPEPSPTANRSSSTTEPSTPTAESTPSPAGSCSAVGPPRPTTAETPPEPYPDRPSQLSTETVESFVRAYERSYQYNEQLAAHPDKIGRLNDLDVSILDATVESEGERFTAVVSGQRNFGIVETSDTPTTPTRTPLPIGHGPFEVSYALTDRAVSREGSVVECW